MADPLRVGFVGCGRFATQQIYPNLRACGFELVACCATTQEKAESWARRFGGERGYADYRRMFDTERLDAAFVIGPPALHTAAGQVALDRGLPLFVEKPPADSSDAVRALIAARDRAGVTTMVGFNRRFSAGWRRAWRLVNEADFGRKTHYYSKFNLGPAPSLTTQLFGWGSHYVDAARYFMGEIERVHVHRCRLPDTSSLNVEVEFTSGAHGVLVFCDQVPRMWERIEITGTKRLVVVDDITRVEYHAPSGLPDSGDFVTDGVTVAEATAWNAGAAIGYAHELRHFAAAIRGEVPQEATLEDGLRQMELSEEIRGQAERE
jgi:myo-inositol 2-dehydrogenase/D-chiro-inositol 1-dehydrogenase